VRIETPKETRTGADRLVLMLTNNRHEDKMPPNGQRVSRRERAASDNFKNQRSCARSGRLHVVLRQKASQSERESG